MATDFYRMLRPYKNVLNPIPLSIPLTFMEQRLTEDQLRKLVAEVDRLSEKRNEELTRTEVESILQEQGLPPELLDEAMTQMYRREALKTQRRRNRWTIGASAAFLLLAIAIGTGWFYQERQTMDRIVAQQDRVNLVLPDDGSSRPAVSRPATLYYHVRLENAPIGKKLDLSCDWLNPSGQVVKQTRYQTREITTAVWDTHCRYALGAGEAPGTWRVKMSLEGRQISDATFDVQ